MPPLDEGALFYMPSTMPGISIREAQKLLQVTDRIIKQFPEVDRVLGKAGRADTSTDPAPLSMLETVITLKPTLRVAPRRHLVFRLGARVAEADLPARSRRDHISQEELVNQLNEALKLPGVSNAWTMPIKARIDMLTHRHADAGRPEDLRRRPRRRSRRSARQIEAVLPSVRGTRSVFAERTGGGYFLDFEWNRDDLARYGLSVDEAQAVGAERHRRRERHDHRRGPGALPGERPLHARFPLRPRRARPRARPGLGRTAPDPALAAGRDQGRAAGRR